MKRLLFFCLLPTALCLLSALANAGWTNNPDGSSTWTTTCPMAPHVPNSDDSSLAPPKHKDDQASCSERGCNLGVGLAVRRWQDSLRPQSQLLLPDGTFRNQMPRNADLATLAEYYHGFDIISTPDGHTWGLRHDRVPPPAEVQEASAWVVPAPPPGTIFVTRNSEAVGNRSPGFWNHTAVMGLNGYVIEAQTGQGVLAVPFSTFYRRYPEIQAFRIMHASKGTALASAAISQLGRDYKRRGSNCVTVLKLAVAAVNVQKPDWRTPTQVAEAATVILWRKDQRAGWVESPAPYQGKVTHVDDVLLRFAP